MVLGSISITSTMPQSNPTSDVQVSTNQGPRLKEQPWKNFVTVSDPMQLRPSDEAGNIRLKIEKDDKGLGG